MADDAAAAPKKGPMPPYIAFKTLTDLIDRMEREQPPTRVDPTYLDSYAGGYRPTVIGNLQTMGMLNKANEPTERLKALVAADEAERKKLIGALVRELYADVFALGLNSTQGQFLEAFAARGAQGDTRRKAISFFLKAAGFAGVQTGIHWKTPAAAAPGTRRRTTSAAKPDPTNASTASDGTQNGDADGESGAKPGTGEVVVIDLGAAGKVTLQVSVKWLELDDETFMALRKSVNDLKKLAAAETSSAPLDDGEDGDVEDNHGGVS